MAHSQLAPRRRVRVFRLLLALLFLQDVRTTSTIGEFDDDWYRFDVTATGTISISLTVPASASLRVQLDNSGGSFIDGSSTSSGVILTITRSLAGPSTYYVLVTPGGLGQSSTLENYTLTLAGSTIVNPQPFTDDPLVSGSSVIRAVHITELRARIDALRALHPPLGPYPYTDTITSTTTIKAQHVLDLRQALQDVYDAALLMRPSYTTSPGVGVSIVVADIASLRAAVQAIE